VSGGNAVRVFFINSGDAATISRLTIAAGGTVDPSRFFTDTGGGIFNDGTTTLTNVVITGCSVAFSGGGIYNDSGATMNIIDSVLSNNNAQSRSDGVSAFNGGGAIANAGTVRISRSTISGNTSGQAGDNTIKGDGGAILNDQLLTITNSTITGNSAEGNGGAIRNQSTVAGVSLTITGSTISDNTAERGSGGGIQLLAGSTTAISNSTMNGNRALGTTSSVGFGGGILAGGSLTLTNSTVSGNIAQRDFGGVYVVQASGSVPLSGNTIVTVTGSTIASNTANRNGGGIGTFTGNQKLNLRNTIVSDNAATTGTSQDVNGRSRRRGTT
jgi:parallel beta-helix repeat protein